MIRVSKEVKQLDYGNIINQETLYHVLWKKEIDISKEKLL